MISALPGILGIPPHKKARHACLMKEYTPGAVETNCAIGEEPALPPASKLATVCAGRLRTRVLAVVNVACAAENYYYHKVFLQEARPSPDKLQGNALNSYPWLDSPDASKTQPTVGRVLSKYCAPRQPGPAESVGRLRHFETVQAKISDWRGHIKERRRLILA